MGKSELKKKGGQNGQSSPSPIFNVASPWDFTGSKLRLIEVSKTLIDIFILLVHTANKSPLEHAADYYVRFVGMLEQAQGLQHFQENHHDLIKALEHAQVSCTIKHLESKLPVMPFVIIFITEFAVFDMIWFKHVHNHSSFYSQ